MFGPPYGCLSKLGILFNGSAYNKSFCIVGFISRFLILGSSHIALVKYSGETEQTISTGS